MVHRHGGLGPGVALRVDGTEVTVAELRRRVAAAEILGEAPTTDGGAGRAAVELVVERAAAARGLTVGVDEVAAAVARTATEFVPDGRDGVARALDRAGLAEEDLAAVVRRRLVGQRLADDVTAAVAPVTDADVRAYFTAHRELVTDEHRRILNVRVETAQRAAEVAARARHGEDLSSLAARYSRDEATAATGGDLGERTAAQLDQQYAAAAFAAEPGALFGPVRTGDGWNVGQVVSVQGAVPLTYAEAADGLRTRLAQQRRVRAWQGWLAARLRAADVEYDVEYADAGAPDQPAGPVVRSSWTPRASTGRVQRRGSCRR